VASEDFGVCAKQVPACFAFIGNGMTAEHGGTPLHSHDYRRRGAKSPVIAGGRRRSRAALTELAR
jgi:metal-dependent amidase/aminoacylase/carboxypeptidase family protein